jgi:hypothetical protein
MKSLSVRALALVITIAIGTASCKKQSATEKLKPESAIAVAPLAVNKDAQLLAALFKSAAPKTQFFTVQSREKVTLTTQNGTRYNIPGGAFRRKDGSVPTGPVSVAIRESLTPRDFVLTDKPTANAGEYLISYGEFFVRATEAGADLKLAAPIAVQVPVRDNARPQGKVPMWDGDTTVIVTTNGHNYQNQPVSISTPVNMAPGVDWSQAPTYALFNSTTGTLDFDLYELIRWTNCDAFSGVSGPKTTVLGYFDIFNNATPSSSPEQPSMLFFKPKNINSIVKFSTLILTPPAGFEGFLSYQNTIPIGQDGTFLAITALSGQFYAELKSVTVPAPGVGTNYVPVNFNLQPVSGAQLLTLISDLNNL